MMGENTRLISDLEVLLALAEQRNQTLCAETLQNAINTIISQEAEIHNLKLNEKIECWRYKK